jgi:AcrR family transcriptional regulator
MSAPAGLRERKKQRTRQLIRDTAVRLFMERGFDQVTVAEIAREADFSEATVFNHFPTKEDLIYGQMEAFEQELLEAVRNRPPGQSALAAYAGFVLAIRGLMTEQQGPEQIAAWARLVTASPALVSREREVFAHHTAALANLLAEETHARPDDLTPWIAAHALIGLHRCLLDYVRRQALAGRPNPSLPRSIRKQGERAVAQLEHGFGDYAIKPHETPQKRPRPKAEGPSETRST